MNKVSVLLTSAAVVLVLFGCGAPPKTPVTGADLVATAVAAHYSVNVDAVRETEGRYEWTVSAVNGSEYSWKGTLYVRLVGPANEIVESHDFKIDQMVPPGGKTSGLKFTSAHAPAERGGDIESLKIEVDVAYYEEPAKAGGE
jgi:hypothetical protein